MKQNQKGTPNALWNTMQNLPEGDANFCSCQWKTGVRMTCSVFIWILRTPEVPHGDTAKLVGLVGKRVAPWWGKGWLLYFLWHGLWKSQRKWISNDGSKLKIWNTFLPSCRSPAFVEIILITLISLSVAGILFIEFYLKNSLHFSHLSGNEPFSIL